MKNRIQKITHNLFGTVRMTLDEADKGWFCLSDVCKVLHIGNPSDLKRRLRKRGVVTIETPTKNQFEATVFIEMSYINEENLYRCIFQSRKAEAEQFQDWVFDEVLPQIRKTGGYIPVHDEEGNVVSDAELILRAQRILERTIEEKDALIATQQQQLLEQRPKVLFAKAVELSEDCYTIGDVAHILSSNRVKIGRQRFFNWLRRYKYLQKKSRRPVQKWVEKGIFSVHIYVYTDSYGHRRSYSTTMITGVGVQYFIDKFV